MQKVANDISALLKAIGGLDRRRYTTAIVVAAGQSTRMATSLSKQFLPVDGIPVIARTLLTLEKAKEIREIVLVCREEDREAFLTIAKDYAIQKPLRTVNGGDTRQESVLNGLEAVSDKTKYVAIHDGARCLVTEAMIQNVCLAAYQYGGAIAATKTGDSIKTEGKRQCVEQSPDRNTVWLAQTPQVFKLNLYRAAAYSAKEEGIVATDDAALVERIGGTVKLVDCGKRNLKITTPEDILIAEAFLAAERTQA